MTFGKIKWVVSFQKGGPEPSSHDTSHSGMVYLHTFAEISEKRKKKGKRKGRRKEQIKPEMSCSTASKPSLWIGLGTWLSKPSLLPSCMCTLVESLSLPSLL